MGTSNKPLISIGIPFFNSEKYLKHAINSVLNQSYKHWELFLLDDGSQDNSLDIARVFAKKDSRIIVISDGSNYGLPTRLNELSDLATGEYYCRMDADDMMHPHRLEQQVNYLIKHPKIDLLGSGLITINNENQIIGERKGKAKEKYSLKDLIKSGWAAHPTIMGKSIWFKKNRYDISLKRAQDYDLWLRTVNNNWFTRLEKPYLYYREASTTTLKKNLIANYHSIKIYWKNVKIIGMLNSLKMTLLSIFKPILYGVFWLFGKTHILIERRSVSLTGNYLNNHENIINKITSFTLDQQSDF